MNKQLWSTSSKFPPIPGEEEKTNPGRFGQALATWVREKLIAQGRAISEELIPEDWGWVVMVQRKPFSLWVGVEAKTETQSDGASLWRLNRGLSRSC